jgi:cytochrome P450
MGLRQEDESALALLCKLIFSNWQGQETSAILLSWSMVMLALHPHIQEHLFQEVVEVLGSQQPTHNHVPQLSYMEAFIWETLRLMPPAYIVGRCACHSTHLGEWHLPVGTTVLVSPYLLHRDPTFWPRYVILFATIKAECSLAVQSN